MKPFNITGCTNSMEINKYLTKMLTYKSKILNLSVASCKINLTTIDLLKEFIYLNTLNISKVSLNLSLQVPEIKSLTSLNISSNKLDAKSVEYIS